MEKHRSAPQGGEFQIRNKESGKLIGLRQGSTDNAAPVEQRGSGDGEETRWHVVPAD